MARDHRPGVGHRRRILVAVVSGGVVYFGGLDGVVYAVRAKQPRSGTSIDSRGLRHAT